MQICAVVGCPSNSNTTKGTTIIYHRFPNDIKVQQEWLLKVRTKNTVNESNARVCSRHFTDNDYFPLSARQRRILPLRNLLRKDAVPSLNLPSCSVGVSIGISQTVGIKNDSAETDEYEFTEELPVVASTVNRFNACAIGKKSGELEAYLSKKDVSSLNLTDDTRVDIKNSETMSMENNTPKCRDTLNNHQTTMIITAAAFNSGDTEVDINANGTVNVEHKIAESKGTVTDNQTEIVNKVTLKSRTVNMYNAYVGNKRAQKPKMNFLQKDAVPLKSSLASSNVNAAVHVKNGIPQIESASRNHQAFKKVSANASQLISENKDDPDNHQVIVVPKSSVVNNACVPPRDGKVHLFKNDWLSLSVLRDVEEVDTSIAVGLKNNMPETKGQLKDIQTVEISALTTSKLPFNTKEVGININAAINVENDIIQQETALDLSTAFTTHKGKRKSELQLEENFASSFKLPYAIEQVGTNTNVTINAGNDMPETEELSNYETATAITSKLSPANRVIHKRGQKLKVPLLTKDIQNGNNLVPRDMEQVAATTVNIENLQKEEDASNDNSKEIKASKSRTSAIHKKGKKKLQAHLLKDDLFSFKFPSDIKEVGVNIGASVSTETLQTEDALNNAHSSDIVTTSKSRSIKKPNTCVTHRKGQTNLRAQLVKQDIMVPSNMKETGENIGTSCSTEIQQIEAASNNNQPLKTATTRTLNSVKQLSICAVRKKGRKTNKGLFSGKTKLDKIRNLTSSKKLKQIMNICKCLKAENRKLYHACTQLDTNIEKLTNCVAQMQQQQDQKITTDNE